MMRSIYNSVEYWEESVRKNKTVKTKMFIDEEITEKTVYMHSIIFTRKSGIESSWIPIPNVRILLGFIQYCFLQEAFYKWSEGKDNIVTKIPSLSVESIVRLGIANGKINVDEAKEMKRQISNIKNMWKLPSKDLMKKLKDFSRDFNRAWIGDSTEFLYFNIFKNSEELAEFILNTNIQTNGQKSFEEKIKLSEQQWINLCKNVVGNKDLQVQFKEILSKHLAEII